MKGISELRDVVREGVKLLSAKQDVKEVEVFTSSNRLSVMRLVYSTNVPSNGLEEPKSKDSYGLSVRVVFKNGKIGFGKEDSDISREALESAYQKASFNRVLDNDFKSLPSPAGKPQINDYHDKAIMELDDEKAIDLSYECLSGALDNLKGKSFRENLNITGELNFLAERMAIANSNGIDEYDETTVSLANLTTIFELESDVAGMWFDSSTKLKGLDVRNTGSTSVEKAYALRNATKVETGEYDVVLGRVALADLIYSRFDVRLSDIDQQSSPYIGKLDTDIGVEGLSICDDGLYPGAIGTKRITDEGLPTGKTEIVKNGKLVNFLSNDYYRKKYSDDPRFAATNGFRFGGGGRHYDSEPGVSATNLVIEKGDFGEEELIKEVKDGLYIGRLWYSYPVNGLTSADFTSTVRGDSYIIKNGELEKALVPNTLRINDNLERVFRNITGLSRKQAATLAWAQEAVVITPEVAVKGLKLDRIAVGLY